MNPYSFTRRFGLELEFIGNGYEAASRGVGAGYAVVPEGYTHRVTNHWKVVPDCSVSASGAVRGTMNMRYEGELVSPILCGEQGLLEMAGCVSAFAGETLTVNRTCGFHAHFDVSDLSLKQFKNLVKLWVKYEDIFDAFVSASRRTGSQFCKSNLAHFRLGHGLEADCQAVQTAFAAIDRCTTIDQLCRLFPDRYFKLNCEAYFRHRTIEFRSHQGTLNAEKIENWLRLLNFLIESAKGARSVAARKNDGKTGAERIASLWHDGVPAAVRKFFTKRAKELR